MKTLIATISALALVSTAAFGQNASDPDNDQDNVLGIVNLNNQTIDANEVILLEQGVNGVTDNPATDDDETVQAREPSTRTLRSVVNQGDRNTLTSALNTASIANNSASIAAVNRSSERRDAAILALSGGVDIAEGHTFGLDLGFGFVEGAEAVGLNAGFQVPLETIHWNVQGGLATSFSGDDTVGRVSTGISW